jgi:hypothetical protein
MKKKNMKNNNNPEQKPPSQPLIELQAVADDHCKRRGEAAEAAFLAKASLLRFIVAKPWGESQPYDFIVDSGSGFLRVQVKSATYHNRGQYLVRAAGDNGQPYTKRDIDFIAAHVIPKNLWYIVPVEAFSPCTMLHFNPNTRRTSKYEKYLETWCLLDCPRKARGRKDIPRRCRSKDVGVQCAVCPLRTQQR